MSNESNEMGKEMGGGGGGVEYGCHYQKVTLRFFENDLNLTQSSPSVLSLFAKTHFTTEFSCYGYKIH